MHAQPRARPWHVFLMDRVIGDESIVYRDITGGAPLNPETRTRVAMGRYQAGYDRVATALTVRLDELFGFAASLAHSRLLQPSTIEHHGAPCGRLRGPVAPTSEAAARRPPRGRSCARAGG